MEALASRMCEEQSEAGQEYVSFTLNDELYAMDALNVQEIIELSNVTKVPHLPEYLKGVINLRGTIIPVVDLKMKFGMESGDAHKHTCVIVTEFPGGVMGLIVDAVSDVLHMAESSITQAPSFGARVRTDFLKGMGKVGDRLVLVLYIDKVLSDEESAMVAEMAGSPADQPQAA